MTVFADDYLIKIRDTYSQLSRLFHNDKFIESNLPFICDIYLSFRE
jgi:hypothetical protein